MFFLLWGFGYSVQANCTLSLSLQGVVGPANYDYLKRGQDQAVEKRCSSIFLQINTPGGSLESARKIVETIMSSPLPYLCLVSPVGGHAGSAGAIIMQSCHVNGALEGTNLGAASPVGLAGTSISGDLRKKIFQDTSSWVESLAKYRGRNVQVARDIVLKAQALDAMSAQKQGFIDHVVPSSEDFLNLAKGSLVRVHSDRKARVEVGELKFFVPDLRFHVMQVISNPQWAYLIFMGSLGLIYFEVTHPGMILPGVVGVMGVLISLMNFHFLNISWGGVALMFLGLVLILSEVFFWTFGALALGGLVSFFIGSSLLFSENPWGLSLSQSFIILMSSLFFLFVGCLYVLVSQAQKYRIKNSEKKSWLGKTAQVQTYDPKTQQGLALFQGELWKIESPQTLGKNTKVVIKEVQGLTLKVEKERCVKTQ